MEHGFDIEITVRHARGARQIGPVVACVRLNLVSMLLMLLLFRLIIGISIVLI
jgi:hypothetical protein